VCPSLEIIYRDIPSADSDIVGIIFQDYFFMFLRQNSVGFPGILSNFLERTPLIYIHKA
jgi:hypothetical protein